MAQGIGGGGGGGGKDPKSKIGQVMNKVTSSVQKVTGKGGDSGGGSLLSGMANSAKGPDMGE